MSFRKDGSALVFNRGKETLRIEPHGKNALRVRATKNPSFSGLEKALTEMVSTDGIPEIISADEASVANGRIKAVVNGTGVISFYRDDSLILREYYSYYGGSLTKSSICLKIRNREYEALSSEDYKITLRFEGDRNEKLYGMGQYQQSVLDLQGCVLPLEQRNSQITIPFVLSSKGYGFLWNNPGTGEAVFGRNQIRWTASEASELDYWITADETPADIIANYTEAVGRMPVISKNYLGLWQCKLRYRTPEEVLEVFDKYLEMGIHLDVIVIDFFHWTYQGDWKFDPLYWPEDKVRAMCEHIHAHGTKIMVSVWPSVDKRSENYYSFLEAGFLSDTEKGGPQTYDFQGDCGTLDVFAPGAAECVWDLCRQHYRDLGIDLFWLDNCEPDTVEYDYDNIRYRTGRATKVGSEYPKVLSKAFAEGMRKEGETDFLSLVRSAWVGSQKYNTLIWSGDVQSNFEALRDQVIAGQNIGIAGIPMWTTDIGGFMTDDVDDPLFRELLIRWFEYASFCPVMRMHGDRGPHDIDPLDDRPYGGGSLYTGRPNEIWSYGEDNMEIMKKFIDIRNGLKDYIEGLVKEASLTGMPLIRAMYLEFPDDREAAAFEDQYMFGGSLLVAPVLEAGARSREVYLPEGIWEDFYSGEQIEGGRVIKADAPLDKIPVFRRR